MQSTGHLPFTAMYITSPWGDYPCSKNVSTVRIMSVPKKKTQDRRRRTPSPRAFGDVSFGIGNLGNIGNIGALGVIAQSSLEKPPQGGVIYTVLNGTRFETMLPPQPRAQPNSWTCCCRCCCCCCCCCCCFLFVVVVVVVVVNVVVCCFLLSFVAVVVCRCCCCCCCCSHVHSSQKN